MLSEITRTLTVLVTVAWTLLRRDSKAAHKESACRDLLIHFYLGKHATRISSARSSYLVARDGSVAAFQLSGLSSCKLRDSTQQSILLGTTSRVLSSRFLIMQYHSARTGHLQHELHRRKHQLHSCHKTSAPLLSTLILFSVALPQCPLPSSSSQMLFSLCRCFQIAMSLFACTRSSADNA